MKLKSIGILAALVLCTSQAAAQSGPLRYGCDTATGRFSPVSIPFTTSSFMVQGTITPKLFRADERWLPSAFVRVRGRNQQSITVALTAENGQADAAQGAIIVRNGDNRNRANSALVPLNSELPFRIQYTDGGDVTITVGSDSIAVPNRLGSEIELSLICSTGDFVFSNIGWDLGG